jgi:amino acid adenylation domain-containing protein
MAARMTMATQHPAPAAATARQLFELSPSQLDIFLHQEVCAGIPLYNIGGYVILKESVDVAVFTRAFEQELALHDAFDLRITKCHGEPRQYLCKEPQQLTVLDFSAEADPHGSARQYLQAAFQHDFILTDQVLHFSGLMKLGAQEYWYFSIAHHLIIDGWGYSIWVRRLVDRYLEATGRKGALPAPTASYLERIEARAADARRLTQSASQRYWRDILQQWPGLLLEQRSFDSRGGRCQRSHRVTRTLEGQRYGKIVEFLAQHQFQLHHLLGAALYIYFSRLTGRRSLMLGLPLHNRRVAEKNVIGTFVNVSPCLIAESADAHPLSIMTTLKKNMGTVARHGDVSMSELAQAAAAAGHAPGRLFDVQLNYLKLDYQTDAHLATETRYLPNGWSQMPLALNACDFGAQQSIELQLDVNEAYFSSTEAQLLLERLDFIVGQIMSSPHASIAGCDLIPLAERRWLEQLGSSAPAEPLSTDVADSFRSICDCYPQHIAVRSAVAELTYAELDQQSDWLAQQLSRGCHTSDAPIAVCMLSGPEFLVAILAATKLRRPYLPLDMTYPQSRLQYIVADAQPSIVLTDHSGAECAATLGVECLNVEVQLAAANWRAITRDTAQLRPPRSLVELGREPVCIMYTSGSTGTPKGVVVPHSGILRLVTAPDFMPLGPQTVMLQFCNLCFDVSTFEIWGPLLNGGTVALYPKQPPDLQVLTRTLEQLQVTALWLTAGLFEKWMAQIQEVPPTLAHVLAGGDVVPPASVHKLQQLRPGVVFINGYGPTENSTFSACWVAQGSVDPLLPVPIGRPIRGSSAYVVDAEGRLVPCGERGELWVGGHGVAIEYLNKPQLTAEKFKRCNGPEITERIYKTGDQVRWRADGALEFLGRVDSQVKIRGFRIEIAEIENQLRGHAGIRQAAVVVKGKTASDKYLAAYVCTHEPVAPQLIAAELTALLRQRLPEFMVPAHIVVLDDLPVNGSGKVDRAQLAQLALLRPLDAPAVAAHGVAEEIQRLWETVLRKRVKSLQQNFFEFGGHSLAALEIIAQINERFDVTIQAAEFLAEGTIARQALLLERLLEQRQSACTAIRLHPELSAAPLSFMQQSMWLAHRLADGSHQYNIPGAFCIEGRLDAAALQEAFRQVIARHKPLASILVPAAADTTLVVHDATAFSIASTDITGLTPSERAQWIAAAIREERCRSFELTSELPIRARLVRIAADEHLLLVTLHHIAIDGWSLQNLYAELALFYDAAVQGVQPQIAPLPLQYHDFAIHQRRWVAERGNGDSEDYWRNYLAAAPAEHGLPLDHARPDRPSYRGRVLRARVDAAATSRLREQAAAAGVSLFSMLNAALGVLVGEFSQERDVVVGTPVSGRFDRALHPLIGCFINTLLIRTRYQDTHSLLEVAADNHRRWLEHLRHDQLPYALMLEALHAPQSRSLNPLFQLWIVLHSQSVDALALPGLQTHLLQQDEANTKFDLMVSITEERDGLGIEWLYAQDLFLEQSMQRLLDGYCRVLAGCADSAALPVRELMQTLQLTDDAVTVPMRCSYTTNECVTDHVLAYARTTPDAAALAHPQGVLSYRQLAEKVRRLAALLTDSGVRPGSCVAVCADRTVAGVVALLAIQALGAAYLPIDPELPAQRVDFMLNDAGASLLLTTANALEQVPAARIEVLLLDEVLHEQWLADYAQGGELAVRGSAATIAYVMYTSGSSGMPKGVKVSRRNIAHYVAALCERYDFSAAKNFAVASAFHTDLGNTTLYTGLWRGGCLHLMERALMLDGRAVYDYVHSRGIDVMKITPSHFAALCDADFYPAPVPRRLLIFGGEVLRRELLQQIREQCLQRGCRVINHYGPTEATIGCLTDEIELRQLPEVATLGTPLPGEAIRIVTNGRPVPRGAWGELVVYGPGVSDGYLNRDDLTAERFVADELIAGKHARAYRTGDRARIGADGRVIFGGRFDDQVKIRGFRIELLEIDTNILACPSVAAAITLVHHESAALQSLVSFVTPAAVSVPELLQRLRATLPDYMIPSRIIVLDALPLLGNGKVDRRALAQHLAAAAQPEAVERHTATEHRLHTMLTNLLGRQHIGIHQGFFDLGGNSLLVTRLTNELSRELNVQVPVKLLMGNPSIKDIAALVDGLQAVTSAVAAEDLVEIDI